jgi:hypothetical protein
LPDPDRTSHPVSSSEARSKEEATEASLIGITAHGKSESRTLRITVLESEALKVLARSVA